VSTSPGQSGAKPARRVTGREIAVGVLALLVIIFVAENTKRVKIRFIIPSAHPPVWIALLITLVVGIVIGWLLARRGTRKRAK
jgi:uncharacterized integral membrane protein